MIVGAGIFDMVDGRVARATGQVTEFGGFFDSVIDRYSDVALYFGLLVYYASINRYFYVVLTAVVMTASVMVSYTRARALSNSVISLSVDEPLWVTNNVGRMPWDTPNRFLAWGHFPTPWRDWSVA